MTEKKKRKVPQPLKVDKKRKSMMAAPMCRLCQTRHWSNKPHQFGWQNNG